MIHYHKRMTLQPICRLRKITPHLHFLKIKFNIIVQSASTVPNCIFHPNFYTELMNKFSTSSMQDQFPIQYISLVLRSTGSAINANNSRRTRLQIIPVVQGGIKDDGSCSKQRFVTELVQSSQLYPHLIKQVY